MPPSSYLLTHPDARLTNGELEKLAAGLAATVRGQAGDVDGDEGEDGND
jgi:hypothetical protein